MTSVAQCSAAAMLAVVLTVTSLNSHAGGFQLNEHSALEMGRAFAGNGLSGGDASSIFYNPAAMRYLDGTRIQAGAALISTDGRFRNQSSVQTLGATSIASAGPNDNGGNTSLVPNFFVFHELNDRVSLGLGITAPFGLKTDYDAGWVGRYHALESELVAVDINPSVAFRATERLSVGFGISAQRADVTLSRAVFLPGPDGSPRPDGFARVEGDDWAFGYNAGLAFDVAERVRVGLSYRSRMSYDFSGHRDLRGVPGAGQDVGVSADTDLPESVMMGLRFLVSDRVSVSVGARWTRWSRFDELRVRFDDGSPDDVTPEDWNNSWTAGIGVDYRFSSRWSAAIGYSMDQSPVPDRFRRTPRIPDTDRRWLTAGVTYQLNSSWRVALSGAYLFIDDAEIDTQVDLVPEDLAPAGTFTDRLVGELSSPSATIASIQIVYGFGRRGD
ncbi:MAG: OmpP1/FadL family transporter [Pseudomonadales bacterium]